MSSGFDSDFSDIDKLIKQLDMMDENVNKSVRDGMKEGAKLIEKEQKALIAKKSSRLAEAISQSRVYANRNNVLGVNVGYQAGAFKAKDDGKTAPGVVGMIFEFGRPGQKGKDTMKQKRGENEVDVTIGPIDPIPHICRGFDAKKEEAAETIAQKLEKAVEKTLGG